MSAGKIDPAEGRYLFGGDPDTYEAVRPAYPDWIWHMLESEDALKSGTRTVEIGPATGLATRELLVRGSNPLFLVEPDKRFNDHLKRLAGGLSAKVEIVHSPFETAELPGNGVDLVVAATSFHWVDQEVGLARARKLLHPNGSFALIWNVFQDLEKKDPFHEATKRLLSPLPDSPSGVPDKVPFALDTKTRIRDLKAAGFSTVDHHSSTWSLELTTTQVGQLYSGFSSVQQLPDGERNTLIDRIMDIAETSFDGLVPRNMTSCLYLAK